MTLVSRPRFSAVASHSTAGTDVWLFLLTATRTASSVNRSQQEVTGRASSQSPL